MKHFITIGTFFLLSLMFTSVGLAAEFVSVKKNDPTCRESMNVVKSKFGTPDEFIELSPQAVTIIFRGKIFMMYTFEMSGNDCIVTSSTH